MDLVTGAHTVAAVLLILAGWSKVRDPGPTVDFVRSLGGKSPFDRPGVVRFLGLFELTVGLGSLVEGGAVAALLTGVIYLLFAVLIGRAMALGVKNCACFGSSESHPSWAHLVIDLSLAALSFVAIGADSPAEVMDSQSVGGAPFMAAVGVVAGVLLAFLRASPRGSSRSERQRA